MQKIKKPKFLQFDLNDEFSRARFLLSVQCLATFLIVLLENFLSREMFTFTFLFEVFIFFMVYNSFFKSLKKLYYSYWGIAVFIGIFLLKGIIVYTFIDESIFILWFYFVSGIFLWMNVYTMSSPIFFPRVQWWEYDFRYRGDIKVDVELSGSKFEGRVIDLRREEGSLELFENLSRQSRLKIFMAYEDEELELAAVIKSKNQRLIGRPTRYGLKFEFNSPEEKKTFEKFKSAWHKYKKVKIRQKFNNV